MPKTYDYIISIEKEKCIYSKIFRNLLLLIAVITQTYFAFLLYSNSAFIQKSYILFVIVFLIVATWVYSLLKKEKSFYRIPIFIAGIGFFLFFPIPSLKYLLAALYFIVGFLENALRVNNEVAVDKEGISINSFPRKEFSWQKLNNVIIKDQLLTIDFKNNKIFQKNIEGDVSSSVEEEFNNFCKHQLENS